MPGRPGHTGAVHEERRLWLEAERQALAAEERRPDLVTAVIGALVTTVPLAVGVASGHRVTGLFCALGGMNVALSLPSGTRVTRRRWGTIALVGSAAGVAAATAVSSSLWLTTLVTLVWVAGWCLFRGFGVPAVVFGPGSIDQAHTVDEWIDIEQVRQASEIYFQFCAHAGG